MKSVMISIQPQWCQLIASGKKTLEVRKTRPKLEAPFKVYIYCTKEKPGRKHQYEAFGLNGKPVQCGGYVIAEFICDDIRCFGVPYPAFQSKMDKSILGQSCLTYYQLHRYAYHDKLYGWHISDLLIYAEPKNLAEFTGLRKTKFGYEPSKLERPPQSWRYVKEAL